MENKFEKWEVVLVKDRDNSEWKKSYYITTIKWAKYPYIAVASSYEKQFLEWDNFDYSSWEQIKPYEQERLDADPKYIDPETIKIGDKIVAISKGKELKYFFLITEIEPTSDHIMDCRYYLYYFRKPTQEELEKYFN